MSFWQWWLIFHPPTSSSALWCDWPPAPSFWFRAVSAHSWSATWWSSFCPRLVPSSPPPHSSCPSALAKNSSFRSCPTYACITRDFFVPAPWNFDTCLSRRWSQRCLPWLYFENLCPSAENLSTPPLPLKFAHCRGSREATREVVPNLWGLNENRLFALWTSCPHDRVFVRGGWCENQRECRVRSNR